LGVFFVLFLFFCATVLSRVIVAAYLINK